MPPKNHQTARYIEIDEAELQQIFRPVTIRTISAAQLAKLLGYTTLTLKNYAANPEKHETKIPPPIKRRGENVWDLDTVVKWLEAKNSKLIAEGQQ